MDLLNGHRKDGEPVIRHDTLKKTTERLELRGVISFTPLTDMIEVGKGAKRATEVYHLNEDDSYTVVAQLCPEWKREMDVHMSNLVHKPKKSLGNLSRLREQRSSSRKFA